MNAKYTPGPWFYVTGAAWTTPQGPDDGGYCIATRASAAPINPSEKDANLRLIAEAPAMVEALRALIPLAIEALAERATSDNEEDREQFADYQRDLDNGRAILARIDGAQS